MAKLRRIRSGFSMNSFMEEVRRLRSKSTMQFDLLKCAEELGEVIQCVVKRHKKSRLELELGDLLFCIYCVMDDMGIDPDVVMKSAIKKSGKTGKTFIRLGGGIGRHKGLKIPRFR